MKADIFCEGCLSSKFKDGVKPDEKGNVQIICSSIMMAIVPMRMDLETGKCNCYIPRDNSAAK